VGSLPATFQVIPVDGGSPLPRPTGPFAVENRHVSPKRLGDLDSSAVYDYMPPSAPALPVESVVQSWSTGLAHPWGLGLDSNTGKLWVGDVAMGGGGDQVYGFTMEGIPTGETVDVAQSTGGFAADMGYDPFTQRFWQVRVGGRNCILEWDPFSRALTGQSICPAFGNSQRGLAMNPLDRTFFSGSWTNGILYHFDATGRVLDSANLGVNIAGLALNPSTHRLFVLSNAERGFDIYVFSLDDGYRLLGGFDVPGLDDFRQAGLDIDCSGQLWLADQGGTVFGVQIGETGACAWNEIPWLSVSPLTGSVDPGLSQDLTLTLDASQVQYGHYMASLVITTDTPYQTLYVPITLSVFEEYEFTLEPQSQSQSGDRGQSVTYAVTLTNTGKQPDQYRLIAPGSTPPGGWPIELPQMVGPLSPGESETFTVTVHVPLDVPGGMVDVAMVMVESSSRPEVTSSFTLSTTSRLLYFVPWLLHSQSRFLRST